MIRTLKLVLGLTPMFAAALVVGLCQESLAQGDADLEVPGMASFPTPVSGGATLFRNVRIFDGKNSALSAPADVLVQAKRLIAYPPPRLRSMRRPTSGLSQRTGAC